jgi:hypothetical protein
LAFDNCGSLSSICIPSSVTTLGRDCFADCISLSAVTFESDSQLASIGEGAFWGCNSLSSFSFPASVTMIGPSCFSSCSLSKLTFASHSQVSILGTYSPSSDLESVAVYIGEDFHSSAVRSVIGRCELW